MYSTVGVAYGDLNGSINSGAGLYEFVVTVPNGDLNGNITDDSPDGDGISGTILVGGSQNGRIRSWNGDIDLTYVIDGDLVNPIIAAGDLSGNYYIKGDMLADIGSTAGSVYDVRVVR